MPERLIRQEATLIRRTLEQIAHTLDGLQSFPHGACGNASVLLGEWLIRKGIEDVEYVSGSSNVIKSHAWLECDGLIIDITADQYGADMPPVFVGRVRGLAVHGLTGCACAVGANAPCRHGLLLAGTPRTDNSYFHDRFEVQSRHACVMDGVYDRANYAALEIHLFQCA